VRPKGNAGSSSVCMVPTPATNLLDDRLPLRLQCGAPTLALTGR
jgi:hypothetical protein